MTSKRCLTLPLRPENIEVKAEDIEVKPENIKIQPDIYLDSNSQMETDEVECINLTTDTDSETSDVTVENYGRHIKKKDKAKYKINSVVLLHLQSQS